MVPTLLEWWDRDQSRASKHRVDTLMPAVAWRLVEEVMFGHCFDERGFRAKERVKSTDLNALKSIRRGLNARENHPAMSQRGAIGLVNEVIPAWKLTPDERQNLAPELRYSPYPGLGEFVVLVPESRTVNTKKATQWVEATRKWDWPICHERAHLAFTLQ